MQYARSRIEVQGELSAMLIVGQFYLQKPSTEEETERLEALAQKYHINTDLLTQASKQISILDDNAISQISGWLERVSSTFEKISSERINLMGRLRQIAEMSIIE
jgi:capsule polysaccharide export protein KpsC/LpsZ